MGIPLQSGCDPEKPEEHALWALVRMNRRMSAPLMLPRPAMEEQSQHLWDCGFRHHPELQTKHYVPPSGDSGLWDSAAGEWVEGPPPVDDTAGQVEKALAGMSPEVREELRRQLREEEG